MAQLPPTSPAPAPQSGSNRTLWIVLGSCLGGGLLLTICAAIIIIGSLTIIGRRVSSVFTQINSGLEIPDPDGFVLPTAEPVDVGQALAIGAPARSGELELTVSGSSIERSTSAVRASAGNEFRAVDVQITNRGAEEANLGDDLLFSWVQDDAERSYDCCVFGLMDDASSDVTLAPGASATLRLVFELPRSADALYWVYSDEQAEDGALVFKLR